MGLAGKIKNSNGAASTTPQQPASQPQQHTDPFYQTPSAPAYDYPQWQQPLGSPDGSYGAPPSPYGAPPSPYGYPQQSLQHAAPSAPPLTGTPQYYGDSHSSYREHPGQPQRQSLVESSPYGTQGHPPPYAGQGDAYASYHEQPVLPQRQSFVESSPYGTQGHPGQGYAEPVQEPSSKYGMPSHAPPSALAHTGYMQQGSNMGSLAQKLQAIIQANGLHPFYDQARFQATLQKVASINFAEIAAQWKIGKELAYDLAPLALYDIVFYCDDSGSMAFEENGERIDDLKFILSNVSGIATKFDDDGIIVRFMNSDVNGDGIRSAADVASLISKVRFSGMTPLGTNFDRKIIQPFVIGQAMSNMAKPVLAIIITDGEPSGEDHGMIRRVIHRAKDALTRTRYGGGAFAVQIAQVGKDARTQRFLESLDKDPVIGGMIDCTSYYELEEEEFARKGVTLTPELWLLKMCVGAIDPEYDSKDD